MEGRDRAFKALLLEMGQIRSVDTLLQRVTGRLLERPHVALARIWLRRPGDLCATCPMAAECPDRTECLHLVSSAGRPVAEAGADWSRIDGAFRRFPLGVRKIGMIVATGEAVEIRDVARDSEWIARPEWAERERIRGFAGQPLLHQQKVLGVLGVFTRRPMDHDAFEWLRTIADHTAAALANARAFEEIEDLRRRLALENACLREDARASCDDLIGRSPALRRVVEQIRVVGPTDANVLVTGESGTGKELVARALHRASSRADGPLIRVNCASIPRDLYESEFFGHARGAFTGALRDREGRFAAADGGTLFLDEVGEIPMDLQSKLLRVLQERQYERVGEERTRKVDVRIVAATNRDIERDVARDRFRRDLYYRLNVFPIHIPPLRERAEDIPLLADAFLERLARAARKPRPRLTDEAVAALRRYPWPGNVRELHNVLERAVITARGRALRIELPGAEPALPEAKPAPAAEILTDVEIRRRERANLLNALERAAWRVSGPGGAADLLGVRPTTLSYRMRKFGLERPR